MYISEPGSDGLENTNELLELLKMEHLASEKVACYRRKPRNDIT